MTESKTKFSPQNPDFESEIHKSFAKQAVMNLLEAELIKVLPGEVEIQIPFSNKLTQQHGYLHAGIVTTIVDTACGYAAYTLMPPESSVLSIEFKVNLMSPAIGDKFIARGKVIKPGKTITFCEGEVIAINGDEQKVVSTMAATMIRAKRRSE